MAWYLGLAVRIGSHDKRLLVEKFEFGFLSMFRMVKGGKMAVSEQTRRLAHPCYQSQSANEGTVNLYRIELNLPTNWFPRLSNQPTSKPESATPMPWKC